ncbi:unnamed protein product [Caenorhabditis auriculariae]|uniref:MYND-type domain-containing protein n=1 Tax=Caenorhabditis auriculariae TaxID=2777116 RepID=A0A8S1H392_9PELO|nr:unnamed protein product [Caenorhabditis auriculariae]
MGIRRVQDGPRTSHPDSFHAFLTTAFSALLAASIMEQSSRGPPSVLALLQTDEMPSSCSEDEPSTSTAAPPLPSLLQSNLPTYLHTINEEESDDVRSASSLASPQTVVDRRNSDPFSQLSPFPDDDHYSNSEVEDTEVIVDEVRLSVSEPEVREGPLDLLKELAKIGKSSQKCVEENCQTTGACPVYTYTHTYTSSEEPSAMSAADADISGVPTTEEVQMQSPETSGAESQPEVTVTTEEVVVVEEVPVDTSKPEQLLLVPEMEATPLLAFPTVSMEHDDEEIKKHQDADRDQEEELVFNDERRKTVTMEDNASLHSASITLDTTREELQFNESVASNPIDETVLMHSFRSTKDEKDTERPRSPLDLPPPPTSLAPQPTVESAISASRIYQTPTVWKSAESPRLPTTLIGAQPPPSILSSRSPAPTYSYHSGVTGMSVPPTEAPPLPPPSPPPPPPAYLPTSSFPKSDHSSREDLLSEHATSRSTVREIPVQRAPSTAPSHSSVFDYRMPSSYHHTSDAPPSDEYYRREVMTRTIITRSTEALSQPPLGRSSPIDRYLQYGNDGRTREERTVDYKVTYHRDIEEEERRVREDQERRRQDEEDRRRREEENRLQWEQKEREALARLREQQLQHERQLEISILERERNEKERIDRDRNERKRLEMQRRAEWERLENERIALEEADLARKRLVEKERLEREKVEEERRTRERLEKERERLERERLENERRERERQERERIERERIERERIEIERIERIKRERIERERKEREKEKEEEDRLRKEREELERLERERRELEIREREALELQRREAEEHERQRLEDEAREMRRREEERREAELVAKVQQQAEEREMLRKRKEREEQERLDRIRREQQRIDMERVDAERRERERAEEERRERELFEASHRSKEMRERERLEDLERERLRQEEERRERDRREQERRAAAERERQRRLEEEKEQARLMELERAAAIRRAQRDAELERERERDELDRKARQIAEMERLENERRERERLEEEAALAKLRDQERRNREIRDRERREAAEREEARRKEDRRSRDKLDYLARERTEKEIFEAEKRRLLSEKEKLTQPAYYSREPAEYTTKVERQVIERIDRNLWVEDAPLYPTSQNAISYSLDSTNDENARDRIFNQNDLNRNGSSRSRYHRAKMDKARRDFYSSTQDSTDAVGDRFRKSNDDISVRARPDYRGPLLQKFHESGFKSAADSDGLAYRRVGPSPYSQEFERLLEETERKYAAYRNRMSQPSLYGTSRHWSTNYLDNADSRKVITTEIHNRAGSVVAYERDSRRDSPADNAHIRSRSADYLMDRKIREETEVPENQLQKSAVETSPPESRLSEHELRFRKSTEKLTVPDWYREHRTNTSNTTTTYRPYPPTAPQNETSDGITFPQGMFDKYRDEIEDLRRSRSSLHQLAEQPQRQGSQISIADQSRALPGYTVSDVPNEWKIQSSSRSRVVEVADTFVGTSKSTHDYGNFTTRYGGRVTIEEVLDSIFQRVAPTSRVIDTSYPMADDLYQGNLDNPSIYTNNFNVMHQVIKQPERAEHLLRDEELFVRCAQCHRTRELSAARLQFVSCKNCYTYYCSRECRANNWAQHAVRCSFARINTLCKDVRVDEEAQAFMSKVAREGFANSGRGSVNIRLNSPQLAQAYVSHGWRALAAVPLNQLLYYYTIAALVQEKKEPSLIALCRRYEPREKFILSVSIIADIEQCPETPPPETRDLSAPVSAAALLSPPYYQPVPIALFTESLVPSDV